MQAHLGLDVGSVSTNVVVMDADKDLIASIYLRTKGEPIKAVQAGLLQLQHDISSYVDIASVGVTGSGRQLASVLVGADVVKNEITAHAVAALHINPQIKTVMEIGGQDSKIILIRDGIVVDFAMNTVCAAGTGSFLDRQAARLGLPIEEFGGLALRSQNPTRIAGRCAVFAESDMIHKQQMGYRTEDIVKGLCDALVRNYLNNVAKGKDIVDPVLFQGGVAANCGIQKSLTEALGLEIGVPKYHKVMGAYGSALIAYNNYLSKHIKTNFRGFEVAELPCTASSFLCDGCPNECEVINFIIDDKVVARWGDKCGKWNVVDSKEIAASS